MKNEIGSPSLRFKGFTDLWEQHPLEQLTAIKDSARISNALWTEAGVPYIRASDLTNEDLSGVLFLSKETFEFYKSQTGAPVKGDVLFNGGGEIGKAVIKNDDAPIYVQGGAVLYATTSSAKDLDGQYLKSYFESSIARAYIDIASAGGTMKHFTLKPAKEMPIIHPGKSEQMQIGTFFRRLDDLITLHQHQYDRFVSLKKAILIKMFPANGKDTPEIRIEGFTAPWQRYELAEIGEKYATSALGYSDLDARGKHKCVLYGELYTKYNERVISVSSRTNVDATMSKKNDLLFPTSTTVDAISLIAPSCMNEDGVRVGGDMFGIRPYAGIDGNFVSYCINNIDYVKRAFAKNAQGLTIVHLHYDAISHETLLLPSYEEQTRIAQLLINIDDLIALHEKKLGVLGNLKKAMLQKMFPVVGRK